MTEGKKEARNAAAVELLKTEETWVALFFFTDEIPTTKKERKITKNCTSRESNPGLYRGRVLFYH
jgi:hypothetical protein